MMTRQHVTGLVALPLTALTLTHSIYAGESPSSASRHTERS